MCFLCANGRARSTGAVNPRVPAKRAAVRRYFDTGTAPLINVTMASSDAPGWNTAATPWRLRAAASSSGTIPPTITITSVISFSRSSSSTRGTIRLREILEKAARGFRDAGNDIRRIVNYSWSKRTGCPGAAHFLALAALASAMFATGLGAPALPPSLASLVAWCSQEVTGWPAPAIQLALILDTNGYLQ